MSGSKATFNELVMRPIHLWGISIRFRMLSPRSWASSSRVTHPFATNQSLQAVTSSFDLHVLGMPPAFVLSQDQTLMFK